MKKSVASRENIIIFIVVTFVTPSPPNCVLKWGFTRTLGWFKTPVSSQTEKLMATTKFSDQETGFLNHPRIFVWALVGSFPFSCIWVCTHSLLRFHVILSEFISFSKCPNSIVLLLHIALKCCPKYSRSTVYKGYQKVSKTGKTAVTLPRFQGK